MTFHAETENGGIKPVLLNYGGAEKVLSQMNDEELERVRQSVLRRVKEKAFSKGLPIYFAKEGQVFAQYADGRIEVVANG